MLLTFDVDCDEDLFPGHRVVLRGLVDGGRSRDDLTGRDTREVEECQVVGLSYELLPGVTRAEAAAREGRPFTLDATYDADVPLPWSTGGAGPDGLAGPSSVEVYDEDVRAVRAPSASSGPGRCPPARGASPPGCAPSTAGARPARSPST